MGPQVWAVLTVQVRTFRPVSGLSRNYNYTKPLEIVFHGSSVTFCALLMKIFWIHAFIASIALIA